MGGDDDDPRWNRATMAATPKAGIERRRPESPAGPRFTLGDELGRGGMGRVVEATDTALERVVAINRVATVTRMRGMYA